jgi:hypothetical protein
MRLMLHTFKKDVRRLWPAAAIVWVMLAVLAYAERWRALSEEIAGEGYLTLLTTMAWAFLVALAVLEEPLAGDCNFWTTRPHRWPSLLGAKLLFAALVIHLPSLLADMLVLAGIGFPPSASFGHLLWKQILFAGAVTLPSIALASLVRSFTHFVMLVFAIATAVLTVSGVFGTLIMFAAQNAEVHLAVVRISIAVAALAAIWAQYAQRRAIPARVIVVAGALTAASLFALLPARAEYAVPGTGSQEPRISLRDAPIDDAVRNRFGTMQAVALPIEVASVAGGDRFHISTYEVEIEMPGSVVFRSIPVVTSRFSFAQRFDVYTSVFFPSSDSPRGWLWLRFKEPAWERVKDARVRIRGAATFQFYRPGQTTVIPAQGRQRVPDLGWCTSVPQDDSFSGMTAAFKLVCESLSDHPAASVTLRHEASGWKRRVDLQNLSVGFRYAGVHEKWFSPLHLGGYYFHLLTNAYQSYLGGTEWMMPMAYFPSARLEITPEISTGRALTRFDFGEVTLAPWLLSR